MAGAKQSSPRENALEKSGVGVTEVPPTQEKKLRTTKKIYGFGRPHIANMCCFFLLYDRMAAVFFAWFSRQLLHGMVLDERL